MKLKEVAGMGLYRVLDRSEKGPFMAKIVKNGQKLRFYVDVMMFLLISTSHICH